MANFDFHRKVSVLPDGEQTLLLPIIKQCIYQDHLDPTAVDSNGLTILDVILTTHPLFHDLVAVIEFFLPIIYQYQLIPLLFIAEYKAYIPSRFALINLLAKPHLNDQNTQILEQCLYEMCSNAAIPYSDLILAQKQHQDVQLYQFISTTIHLDGQCTTPLHTSQNYQPSNFSTSVPKSHSALNEPIVDLNYYLSNVPDNIPERYEIIKFLINTLHLIYHTTTSLGSIENGAPLWPQKSLQYTIDTDWDTTSTTIASNNGTMYFPQTLHRVVTRAFQSIISNPTISSTSMFRILSLFITKMKNETDADDFSPRNHYLHQVFLCFILQWTPFSKLTLQQKRILSLQLNLTTDIDKDSLLILLFENFIQPLYQAIFISNFKINGQFIEKHHTELNTIDYTLPWQQNNSIATPSQLHALLNEILIIPPYLAQSRIGLDENEPEDNAGNENIAEIINMVTQLPIFPNFHQQLRNSIHDSFIFTQQQYQLLFHHYYSPDQQLSLQQGSNKKQRLCSDPQSRHSISPSHINQFTPSSTTASTSTLFHRPSQSQPLDHQLHPSDSIPNNTFSNHEKEDRGNDWSFSIENDSLHDIDADFSSPASSRSSYTPSTSPRLAHTKSLQEHPSSTAIPNHHNSPTSTSIPIHNSIHSPRLYQNDCASPDCNHTSIIPFSTHYFTFLANSPLYSPTTILTKLQQLPHYDHYPTPLKNIHQAMLNTLEIIVSVNRNFLQHDDHLLWMFNQFIDQLFIPSVQRQVFVTDPHDLFARFEHYHIGDGLKLFTTLPTTLPTKTSPLSSPTLSPLPTTIVTGGVSSLNQFFLQRTGSSSPTLSASISKTSPTLTPLIASNDLLGDELDQLQILGQKALNSRSQLSKSPTKSDPKPPSSHDLADVPSSDHISPRLRQAAQMYTIQQKVGTVQRNVEQDQQLTPNSNIHTLDLEDYGLNQIDTSPNDSPSSISCAAQLEQLERSNRVRKRRNSDVLDRLNDDYSDTNNLFYANDASSSSSSDSESDEEYNMNFVIERFFNAFWSAYVHQLHNEKKNFLPDNQSEQTEQDIDPSISHISSIFQYTRPGNNNPSTVQFSPLVNPFFVKQTTPPRLHYQYSDGLYLGSLISSILLPFLSQGWIPSTSFLQHVSSISVAKITPNDTDLLLQIFFILEPYYEFATLLSEKKPKSPFPATSKLRVSNKLSSVHSVAVASSPVRSDTDTSYRETTPRLLPLMVTSSPITNSPYLNTPPFGPNPRFQSPSSSAQQPDVLALAPSTSLLSNQFPRNVTKHPHNDPFSTPILTEQTQQLQQHQQLPSIQTSSTSTSTPEIEILPFMIFLIQNIFVDSPRHCFFRRFLPLFLQFYLTAMPIPFDFLAISKAKIISIPPLSPISDKKLPQLNARLSSKSMIPPPAHNESILPDFISLSTGIDDPGSLARLYYPFDNIWSTDISLWPQMIPCLLTIVQLFNHQEILPYILNSRPTFLQFHTIKLRQYRLAPLQRYIVSYPDFDLTPPDVLEGFKLLMSFGGDINYPSGLSLQNEFHLYSPFLQTITRSITLSLILYQKDVNYFTKHAQQNPYVYDPKYSLDWYFHQRNGYLQYQALPYISHMTFKKEQPHRLPVRLRKSQSTSNSTSNSTFNSPILSATTAVTKKNDCIVPSHVSTSMINFDDKNQPSNWNKSDEKDDLFPQNNSCDHDNTEDGTDQCINIIRTIAEYFQQKDYELRSHQVLPSHRNLLYSSYSTAFYYNSTGTSGLVPLSLPLATPPSTTSTLPTTSPTAAASSSSSSSMTSPTTSPMISSMASSMAPSIASSITPPVHELPNIQQSGIVTGLFNQMNSSLAKSSTDLIPIHPLSFEQLQQQQQQPFPLCQSTQSTSHTTNDTVSAHFPPPAAPFEDNYIPIRTTFLSNDERLVSLSPTSSHHQPVDSPNLNYPYRSLPSSLSSLSLPQRSHKTSVPSAISLLSNKINNDKDKPIANASFPALSLSHTIPTTPISEIDDEHYLTSTTHDPTYEETRLIKQSLLATFWNRARMSFYHSLAHLFALPDSDPNITDLDGYYPLQRLLLMKITSDFKVFDFDLYDRLSDLVSLFLHQGKANIHVLNYHPRHPNPFHDFFSARLSLPSNSQSPDSTLSVLLQHRQPHQHTKYSQKLSKISKAPNQTSSSSMDMDSNEIEKRDSSYESFDCRIFNKQPYPFAAIFGSHNSNLINQSLFEQIYSRVIDYETIQSRLRNNNNNDDDQLDEHQHALQAEAADNINNNDNGNDNNGINNGHDDRNNLDNNNNNNNPVNENHDNDNHDNDNHDNGVDTDYQRVEYGYYDAKNQLLLFELVHPFYPSPIPSILLHTTPKSTPKEKNKLQEDLEDAPSQKEFDFSEVKFFSPRHIMTLLAASFQHERTGLQTSHLLPTISFDIEYNNDYVKKMVHQLSQPIVTSLYPLAKLPLVIHVLLQYTDLDIIFNTRSLVQKSLTTSTLPGLNEPSETLSSCLPSSVLSSGTFIHQLVFEQFNVDSLDCILLDSLEMICHRLLDEPFSV